MKYNVCTVMELRKFIKDRSLSLPTSGPNTKKACRELLEKADSERKFNLLGLAAEMRNMIYAEALTLRLRDTRDHSCDRRCDAQILRVCKQIHDEAAELLYSVNTVTVVVGGEDYPMKSESVETIKVHRISRKVKGPGQNSIFPMRNVATGSQHWHAILSRVERVELCVNLGNFFMAGGPRPNTHLNVNNILYTLAASLSASKKLRYIDISFKESHGRVGKQKLQSILYPLSLLPTLATCKRGDLPDGVLPDLEKPMQCQAIQWGGKLLLAYHVLAGQTQTYMNMCKEVGTVAGKQLITTMKSEEPLDRWVAEVMKKTGYIDEAGAANFKKSVAAWEYTMATLDDGKMREAATRKMEELASYAERLKFLKESRTPVELPSGTGKNKLEMSL